MGEDDVRRDLGRQINGLRRDVMSLQRKVDWLERRSGMVRGEAPPRPPAEPSDSNGGGEADEFDPVTGEELTPSEATTEIRDPELQRAEE